MSIRVLLLAENITEGMGKIISQVDNVIFTSVIVMFFSLMYVAIGIGVAKKMFLFGNMQTVSIANKIIMTAFISGVVAMIILPIKDDVTTRLKIENSTITINDDSDVIIGPNGKEVNRYSTIKDAAEKVGDLAKGIYGGVLGIMSTLLAISIAISVIRIKLSMGNAEIIGESRKMIRIAIVGFITLLAANGIFVYFENMFNKYGLSNPILNTITAENTDYTNNKIYLTHKRDVIDKFLMESYERTRVSGLISFTDENGGNKKRIWPILNEVYSFSKVEGINSKLVNYTKGGFFIQQLPDQGLYMLYINFGYKATLTTNDGFVVIKVPRREVAGSKLENISVNDNNNILSLSEDEQMPEPAPSCERILFSSIGGPDELKPDYEYKFNYRYLGELFSWGNQFGTNRRYSFSVTLSEDNEKQKIFKRVDGVDNGETNEEIMPDYQDYQLVQDRTKQIREELKYDYGHLNYYIDEINVPDHNTEYSEAKKKINDSLGEGSRGVALYTKKNYNKAGTRVWFGAGEFPDIGKYALGSAVSSIEIVGEGVKIKVWSDPDYRGKDLTFTSSEKDMSSITFAKGLGVLKTWDNRIDSIKVEFTD